MTAGLLDPAPTTGGGAPTPAGPARAAGTPGHGPTPAHLWRRTRGPAALVVALLLVAAVTIALGGRPRSGHLDPVATDPDGARALAVLLTDAGVDVERVSSTDAALAAGPDSTVFLPFPGALPDSALRRIADSGADVVVAGPHGAALARLAPGLQPAGSTGTGLRQPSCDLPAARTAGAVLLGGLTYDTTGAPDATACYEASGGALLVRVERPDGGTTTVLGAGDPFTNGRLASEGNAALGLLLLGGGEEVRWYVPAPGAERPEEEQGLLDLLPATVRHALLLVAVAVALAALWRGRRLGPVVAEPLPVVVRAAETVEGRARLYRAARARDRAADALRDAARARLAPLAGAGADPDPAVLIAEVAARAGLDPAGVGGLLYGPVPEDDRALVRLASDLDALEARMRVPGPASAPSGPQQPSERGPA